nr:cytochrome P450 [Kitasatospora sp. MMS16-BH015]
MSTTRIPGPPGLPLIGSAFELARRPLQAMLAARRDRGDVVRFSVGPPGLRRELYAVFSPEGVQQVLAGEAANFRKESELYEEVRESFGNGLLTAQDTDYQRQRRLVQPLFTKRRVDGYAEAVGVEAAALVDRWAAVPDGVVDTVGEMSRFALRTVARILFGTDVEAAAEVGGDLLGLLAAARTEDGERLDAGELRDQVLIFLLAGHETTATSLTFALHLLGRHPQERRRAREQVERVLGRRPRERTRPAGRYGRSPACAPPGGGGPPGSSPGLAAGVGWFRRPGPPRSSPVRGCTAPRQSARTVHRVVRSRSPGRPRKRDGSANGSP